MRIFLFIIGLITVGNVNGQFNYGWTFGLSFQFGTHINRIGISGAAFSTYAFAQVNATANVMYSFQSFGTKQKTPEVHLGLGTNLGFGNKDSVENPFIGLTENRLENNYSLAYGFIYYWDKIETKQSAGVFALNIGDLSISTENDLFGGGKGWKDRFRTGGFLIEYRYDIFKFGVNATFWTGDYSLSQPIFNSDYPSRFGYKKNNKTIYGNHSVGALSFQTRALLPYQQMVSANVGIDAEQIRNSLQNKLIHDQPFLPMALIVSKPCHIPMLQPNGDIFLYQEGQTIRRPKLYFQLGANNYMAY